MTTRLAGRCRAVALRAALLAMSGVISAAASAATLGDIAAALAAPGSASQATNDWSSFARMKDVKWKGQAPAKGGNMYYWNGSLQLNGMGAGELSLSGSKSAVLTATASPSKQIELAKVPQMLAVQFPLGTKLEQIRGACPDERLSGSRIYRATLAGRKPLYLHIQFAASDRGGSTSTIEMEPQRNKLWTC
jgi:hypothetical protein